MALDYPDDVFATRFNKTLLYGFFVRYTDDEPLTDVDGERFVTLRLNPQQVTMREPIATVVNFTQGGGKYIESRGGIIKHVSVNGTVGFLPPGGHGAHPAQGYNPRQPTDFETADNILGQRSGYLAFYRLRYLFRFYMRERREGNTQVTMHYFDQKGNDYWRIEPSEFTMLRSSRKPYSYDYQISFQCIEETNVRADHKPAAHAEGAGSFTTRQDPLPTLAYTMRGTREFASTPQRVTKRMRAMHTAGVNFAMGRSLYDDPDFTARRPTRQLAFSDRGFSVRRLTGRAQIAFSVVLRHLNNALGFFETVYSTTRYALEPALTALKLLDNSLTGLINTASLYVPENVYHEINAWWLEVRTLTDHMIMQLGLAPIPPRDVERVDSYFARSRMKLGAVSDLLTETDATSQLDAHPAFAGGGLGLVTDPARLAATTATRAVVIQRGESIYALAQRLLGDAQRFIDLVLLNNLVHPYIVSDAGNKPARTLAWGDYINVPADDGLTGVSGAASNVPTFTRTVSRAAIPTELVDEALTTPWRVNQWVGYTVTLTHAGVEYTRVVVANTENTLAVNIAWSPTPVTGDAYTLRLTTFDTRRPITPEDRAYGRGLLLAFRPQTGSNQNPLADLVVGPSGDFAMVTGIENLIQALTLRLHTEQKAHIFHPTFGVAPPVGRPWTEDVRLFYTYFMRRAFLQDPRVANITNTRLRVLGDTVTFSAEIQPAHATTARTFSLTLR